MTAITAPPSAAVTVAGDFVRHTGYLTMRLVRALVRQPWFLAITLVQPIIWLLLFGQLFRSVIRIPGFDAGSGSYLEFLTPGVICMTALFSSAWAGTVYIEDMNRGVMDRLLSTPVSRGAMMASTLAYQAITSAVQTVIIFTIAFISGARFAGGVVGVVFTLLAAALLTMVFAAISNAMALLVRQQEALIGISQFLSLPLSFLGSAIMAIRLAPGWVQTAATCNPMDWAVVVSRQTLSDSPDYGAVLPRLAALAVTAAVMAWVAVRAFGAYRRST